MPEFFYQQLGKRVRKFRERANLSQSELAGLIGLAGRQSVSAIETGEVRLKMMHAAALCEELGITMYSLLGLPRPKDIKVLKRAVPEFLRNTTMDADDELLERAARIIDKL